MDRYLPLIGRSALFHDIDAADLEAMLHCLGARQRSYPKGAAVFRVGDRTTAMGVVLEGSVRLEKEDYWGNRSILASFGPGQSFAEVYACEPDLAFDINVVAAEDAVVLFLDWGASPPYARRRAPSTRGSSATCWASSQSAPTHSRAKSSTRRSAPRAPSCCRTFPIRPNAPVRAASPSPSTAKNWPTTCRWTAAR